ncbi:MAG: SUMF1/EgtB/PvdO family nonheme iron enzyme [Kiritimatiellae bacterium]|nr:SUMF1/EgtB/PvdO family nonheme iron enzyme [Kiritimatiellia bacterium]MDD5519661.1 SUMF1/EgtB/PvdO family nonheme iron enzyme [Kiritimatiellia bacterium]
MKMAVCFSRIAVSVLVWMVTGQNWAQVLAATDSKQPEKTGQLGMICEKLPAPVETKESQAALELARKLSTPVALVPDENGNLLTENGRPADLSGLNTVWFHQGDSTSDGPVYDEKVIDTLRRFVQKGGGLFLSGSALSMVVELGIEKAIPRRGGPGTDGGEAAIVPLLPKHPVFQGWPSDGGTIKISNSGYPAFADFHGTGGPFGGMLLARTPGGMEHPLVEYELGKGRIIAMGWRLPHYSNTNNTFRNNLEKLTANVLIYLGNPKLLQTIVVTKTQEPKEVDSPLIVEDNEWRALEMAIKDLTESFGDRYSKGREYLNRFVELKKLYNELTPEAKKLLSKSKKPLAETVKAFYQLKRDALLNNPLLDFEKILLIKRSTGNLGLPANWQSNSCLKKDGYKNEIAMLQIKESDSVLETIYRPIGGRFVGDVDLHFDGDRVLFSMPGKNGRWQISEMNLNQREPRELELIPDPDVDNYDACYLPDGNIIFTSTAPFVGVPCVRGSSHVSNLYLFNRENKVIRRLTFDQEHNWCPTVLNNGRVLYLRWEYSDLPHFVSRILFHMTPDGMNQSEYYGSNSYWPNCMFYARPIPNHPTAFAAIVTGHHGVARMGELVLFDPSLGRHEAQGVLQRIPGYGKPVEPIILDRLVDKSWPKFLHPYPLSIKYFLVSAQPTPSSNWGIYLVDVFDNMLLLKETRGYVLFEPIPLRPTPKPPVIPPRVKTGETTATIYLANIYKGDGLKGVPVGTVKKLRLITYNFAYHGMGGQVDRVGFDGPWDIKRVIGTVPVEEDGSAMFRVPANTPISMQPLDADGKSLALMRSWTTAMPGEIQSCVGCHERQNTAPPSSISIAQSKNPSDITPWYGPIRGFSFRREVQPVLNAYCVSCHNGKKKDVPDLREQPFNKDVAARGGAHFSPSYMALRKLVRAPTIESDIHLLPPCEFHASTTELIQMLEMDHHNVKLNKEAWSRLFTWIDLHSPEHGTWTDTVGEAKVEPLRERRIDLMRCYSNRDDDEEKVIETKFDPASGTPVEYRLMPQPLKTVSVQINSPVDTMNKGSSKALESRIIDLGNGIKLELVKIPGGKLVREKTKPDGKVIREETIVPGFWVGKTEVSNEQFARFDILHDSRLEHGDFLQFSIEERGYPLNGLKQPVCRVSWKDAMAFCAWLSGKTGNKFTLPDENQWEYACRAGTTTPLWFGEIDCDFAKYANLADKSFTKVDSFLPWRLPAGAIPEWRPCITKVDDHFRVSSSIGNFQTNPWGLYDMHGNVWEWTRTEFIPEGLQADEKQNDDSRRKMIVRGGSWSTRPQRATAEFRLAYPAWQVVYDVGFRVICETDLK